MQYVLVIKEFLNVKVKIQGVNFKILTDKINIWKQEILDETLFINLLNLKKHCRKILVWHDSCREKVEMLIKYWQENTTQACSKMVLQKKIVVAFSSEQRKSCFSDLINFLGLLEERLIRKRK